MRGLGVVAKGVVEILLGQCPSAELHLAGGLVGVVAHVVEEFLAGLAGSVELVSECPSGVDANVSTRVFQEAVQRADGFCVSVFGQRGKGNGGLGANKGVGMGERGEKGVLHFGAVDPRGQEAGGAGFPKRRCFRVIGVFLRRVLKHMDQWFSRGG